MTTRRLAAILAADVVGFSSMMEKDEEGTLAKVKALQREIIEPRARNHYGRVVKTTGDGFIIEFASPVEAVRCAIAVQETIATGALRLRIGINLGDIIIEDDGDVYGDGVNIAARLEGLADSGGIYISGSVFDQIEGKIAAQFESLGEQQVKNISKLVRVYALAGVRRQPTQSAGRPLPLPDRPSIAVLPFTNMSGDAEQEYFADGVVEDIITALSRIRWLFVIARNSSFTYKGKPVDVRQVSRELGVRYVLEGSIRKSGSRVRITGQLIDATVGHHLWADKFDGALEDIFDLQDQITANVVGVIEPNLRQAEIARSRAKPTGDLGAYDLYLRALPPFYSMAKEGLDQAVELLEQALTLDPRFTLAKALCCFARGVRVTLAVGPADDRPVSVRLAREAVAEAPDDADVLRLAAHILGYCGRDYDASINAIDRSLRLNVNSSQAYSSSGWVRLYVDDPTTAIDHFNKAMRLSPLDPEKGITLTGLSFAKSMQGHYDEALAVARRAVQEMPNYPSAHKGLIYTLARVGAVDEAREVARLFTSMTPSFSLAHQVETSPFRNQAFNDSLLEAFRLAGIPEDSRDPAGA